jgi:hypothetical protein
MKQQEKPKSSWGGKRAGAGKKSIYHEPTINVTFRIPHTHKEAVRALVNEYLNKLKKTTIQTTQTTPKEPEYGC